MTATEVGDWRDEKVRDWLFLILRFAITRDAKDRAAVLTLAAEIDARGSRRCWVPRFFMRTGTGVCAAILGVDSPNRRSILLTHARRIDDPRLRRAFLAAVDFGKNSKMSVNAVGGKMSQRASLWRGLRGA